MFSITENLSSPHGTDFTQNGMKQSKYRAYERLDNLKIRKKYEFFEKHAIERKISYYNIMTYIKYHNDEFEEAGAGSEVVTNQIMQIHQFFIFYTRRQTDRQTDRQTFFIQDREIKVENTRHT